MSATHRNIFCCKLQREAPALTHAPYPGDLGQRILAKVSQEAWDMWLDMIVITMNSIRYYLIFSNFFGLIVMLAG